MNKNIFLTSMLALITVTPAMAAVNREALTNNTTYLKYNTIYAEPSATSTVMDGVSSGTVYTNLYYSVLPGYYWPANSDAPEGCSGGAYYCPGSDTAITTKPESTVGREACPTGYTGAPYFAPSALFCTKECPSIPNAKAVGGAIYYNGSNAEISSCAPSVCNPGYHKEGFSPEVDVLSDDVYTFEKIGGTTSGTATLDDFSEFTQSDDNIWGLKVTEKNNSQNVKFRIYGEVAQSRTTYPALYIVEDDEIEMGAGNGTDRTCFCRVTGVQVGNQPAPTSVDGHWVSIGQCGGYFNCATAAAYAGGADYPSSFGILARLSGSETCEASGFTITLNANGGTGGVTSVAATYNVALTSISGQDNLPSRKGYTFDGYYDAPEGGTQYYNYHGFGMRAFDKTEDTTFYAHWTAKEITIVWSGIENANVKTADNQSMTDFDSTNNTAKSVVSYDGKIATPISVVTPSGSSFVGWRFVKKAGN